jgi:hypothetical protein
MELLCCDSGPSDSLVHKFSLRLAGSVRKPLLFGEETVTDAFIGQLVVPHVLLEDQLYPVLL